MPPSTDELYIAWEGLQTEGLRASPCLGWGGSHSLLGASTGGQDSEYQCMRPNLFGEFPLSQPELWPPTSPYLLTEADVFGP